MIKKSLSLLMMLLVAQFLAAQAPKGYYSSSKGNKGRGLKTAMHQIISSHKDIGYKAVWKAFETTDLRPDGKIWDMYSNVTNYQLGKDQAGQFSKEGDAYNREHSFPKSWFNDNTPMHNDLFHLYPTDGSVNGMRSNHPFGETAHPDKQSKNGFSKLGPCSTPGYSGTVFEPNDEYKGDFARTYFYMATCYEDRIATFHSPMLAGNSYPVYKSWAIDMLLRWAKEDPVSQKEIDRNNAVYKIQNNRNPYIDYPGLEQYVWGSKTSAAFDPDNYEQSGGGGEVVPQPEPGDKEVAAPVFSLPSSTVMAGTEVTLSCATQGASIYYTINGGQLEVDYGSVTLIVNQTMEIAAYAMLGESKSATVKAKYFVESIPEGQGNVYEKVYTADQLVVGGKYLIVSEEGHVALAGIAGYNNDVRDVANVTIDAKVIHTEVSKPGSPYALILGKDAQGYTFFDEVTHTYLALGENKNYLPSVGSAESLGAHWTIGLGNGSTTISNAEFTTRSIRYNSDSPRFSTYENKGGVVALYKEKSELEPDGQTVDAPRFSLPSGEVRKGTPLTISCSTPNAMIHYVVNDGTEQVHAAPISLNVEEDMQIVAYAKVGDRQSESVKVVYTLAQAPNLEDGNFVKISNVADLTVGDRYLVVCESQNLALSGALGKYSDYRGCADVQILSNVISTEVSVEGRPFALILGGNEGGYTLYDAASDAYLGLVSASSNKLNNLTKEEADNILWTINFEESNAVIRSVKYDKRTIRYNGGATRFSTYESGQMDVALYKEYKSGETVQVSAPVFSVASGEVEKGTMVSLTCATEGATIYYRVNGGDYQSQTSPVSFTISENTEIEAYAQLKEVKSNVATASYTVSTPVVVSAPVFSVASGEVEKGTTVNLTCATEGATIYYRVNGGDYQSQTSTVSFTISENTEIEAYAQLQEVKSNVVTASYTVSTPVAVSAPVFSVASGEVEKGTTVSLSCATEGVTIYYRVNGGDYQSQTSPVSFTISENTDIEAYAQLQEVKSDVVTASYTVSAEVPDVESKVFVKVQDQSDLAEKCEYLVVCEEFNVAMSAASGKDLDIRADAEVTINEETIKTGVSATSLPVAFMLNKETLGYTFFDATSAKYLAFTGKNNRLPSIADLSGKDAYWNIQIQEGGIADISSVRDAGRLIMYNSDQPRFVAYGRESQQHAVVLYKEVSATGIVCPLEENGYVDVYTSTGRLVRYQVRKEEAVKGLPHGVYVVGGLKLIVK